MEGMLIPLFNRTLFISFFCFESYDAKLHIHRCGAVVLSGVVFSLFVVSLHAFTVFPALSPGGISLLHDGWLYETVSPTGQWYLLRGSRECLVYFMQVFFRQCEIKAACVLFDVY